MANGNETRIPIPDEKDGFIPTLNNMGFMTTSLDPFSQKIVEFAALGPGPFLEIGAAYGIACHEALKRGATVIANDIDGHHLKILSNNAPKNFRQHLSLKAGAFPDGIDFQPASLGSVLICRVLHFFDGPTIERCFKKLFAWLAPGGKLCVVVETPYLGNWSKFLPIYERRKKAGESWPGWVEDIAQYEDGGFLKNLPPVMHLLDLDIMERVAIAAGFVIEKQGYINRRNFPSFIRLDGRESMGLIARKQKKLPL